MRRFLLRTFGAAGLLLLRLLAAASNGIEIINPDISLQVTTRKDSLLSAPSCQHTFTQLELVNTDTSEQIWIHSIQTTPEVTVLLHKDGRKIPCCEGKDPLPQQLHVSRMPGSSLSLGPGQVAIVPVTFLPRFPPDSPIEQDAVADSIIPEPDTRPTILSDWQRADLDDWFGDGGGGGGRSSSPSAFPSSNSNSVRSNYGSSISENEEEYEVKTFIIIETNRGVVTLPVTATSVRKNKYGLPHTIYFDANRHSKGNWKNNNQKKAKIDSDQNQSNSVSVDEFVENLIANDDNSNTGVWIASSDHAMEKSSAGGDPGSSSSAGIDHQWRHTGSNDNNEDCYDLYITNPNKPNWNQRTDDDDDDDDNDCGCASDDDDDEYGSCADDDDDLEVLEVLVSQPEHMSLSVIPEKDKHAHLLASSPRHVVRDLTVFGSLTVPADGRQHYVVTACTARYGVEHDQSADVYLEEMANWIDTGKEDNTLGFLQIRTDSDTLFVGLERQNNNKRKSARSSGQNNRKKQPPSQPASSLAAHNKTAALSSTSSSGLIAADPPSLDLHMFSSSASKTKSIGITNLASSRVTLMRASAALRVPFFPSTRMDGIIDLQVKLRRKNATSDNLISIEPNETIDDAINFTVTVDWEKLIEKISTNPSVQFNGTLVVRSTSQDDRPFPKWEETMKKGSKLDSHLILEIPFVIKILQGKVGLMIQGTSHPFSLLWAMENWNEDGQSVAGMFFPQSANDVREVMSTDMSTDDYKRLSGLKSIDHSLRVISNMRFDMKIKEVKVVDHQGVANGLRARESLCDFFKVSVDNDEKSNPFDLPGHTDLGLIYLRYRFPSNNFDGSNVTSHMKSSEILPTQCFLRMTTDQDSMDYHTPIIIYTGHLDVSSSQFRSEFISDSVNASLRSGNTRYDNESISYRATVGLDKLMMWFQSSKAGSTLRSVLNSRDNNILSRYLNSLSKKSVDLDNSKLRPILLEVGAIAHGEMETLPLYITNHNPLPLLVTIDVGEVEGMSITLGRDPSSGGADGNCLLDHLPRKPRTRFVRGNKISEPRINKGHYRGNPVNGLRQFLMSDKIASSFLAQFPFQDAMSLSDLAAKKLPLLNNLYRTFAFGECHKTQFPARSRGNSSSRCEGSDHPPLYGSFEEKLPSRKLFGPIIVSTDRKVARQLPVCWDKESVSDEDVVGNGNNIVIPPGGVARFDVDVRSPPSSVLDSDISQFLATGLVLSTNHGEVLPILISFEALQGKLEINHAPNPVESTFSVSADRDISIRVPIRLFGHPSSAITADLMISPPPLPPLSGLSRDERVPRNESTDEKGVSLFMRSSFSRDVILRKVLSCNPWFEVILRNRSNSEPDPFLGVNIGAVTSTIPCNSEYGLHDYSSGSPSFFHCVLNWLAKRPELQPRGCGLLPSVQKRSLDTNGNQVAEFGGVEKAARSFKRALVVSEWAEHFLTNMNINKGHGSSSALHKTGRRSLHGVVAPVVIDAAADVWDAWQTVSELGIRVLSTNLRAIIEYNSTRDEKAPVRSGKDGDETHILSVPLRNLTVETVIETPKLFDAAKAQHSLPYAISGNGDSPSTIEFPPTLVANAVPATIPLRNPTSVPVRVRLSVAPSRGDEDSNDRFLEEEIGFDNAIRGRFVGDLPHPYVQTGAQPKQNDHHWWDGGGAFYLADFHGDLVRSHHNITIKAGSGAHVSLVNPSLMSNTAFLAGCGPRCGLREESGKKTSESGVDLRMTSPIGASAAAGTTLVGRQRAASAHENSIGKGEPLHIAAGGSLLSSGSGPAAFAIPYSALDEIVIPPFGEAEVGPIFFRPPGRSATLGCELLDPKKDSCKSQTFESLVFLETSLSGLERIVLRGKAQWEKVIFLDPLPKDGSDAFGDIELRNGRPALIFPGTSEITRNRSGSLTGPRSVVKEVVVHNDGDVPVTFEKTFLSDTTFLHKKHEPSVFQSSSCEFSDFRLLNCSSGGPNAMQFTLLPGQNRSLFIEHEPQCTKRKDFIALNLVFLRNKPMQDSGAISAPRFGSARHSRANDWRKSFRKRKIDLIVGYDMTEEDFASCLPLDKVSSHDLHSATEVNYHVGKYCLFGNYSAHSGETNSMKPHASLCFDRGGLEYLFIIFTLLGMLASVGMSCRCYSSRKKTSEMSRSMLVNLRKGENWSADFRCLSRVGPTSSDLQTLGREQIRQVVLGRYSSLGVLQPHCVNSAGVFHRERGANNHGRRPQKEGSTGGNERMRTLSDAIFRDFNNGDCGDSGLLPCDFGWRAAASKGIINASSLNRCLVTVTTKELLWQRSQNLPADEEQSLGSSSGDEESVTFHASSGDMDYSDDGSTHESAAESSPEGSRNIVSVPTSGATNDFDKDGRIFSKEKTESAISNGSSNSVSRSLRAKTSQSQSIQIEKKNGNAIAKKWTPSEARSVKNERNSTKIKSSRNGTARNTPMAPTKHVFDEKANDRTKDKPRAPKNGRENLPKEDKILVHDATKRGGGKKTGKPERIKKSQAEVAGDEAASKRATKKSLTGTPKKSAWKAGPMTPPSASLPSKGGSAALRPPPGLSPPPGFGGSPSQRPLLPPASSIPPLISPVGSNVASTLQSTGSQMPALASSSLSDDMSSAKPTVLARGVSVDSSKPTVLARGVSVDSSKPTVLAREVSLDSSISGDNLRLTSPSSPIFRPLQSASSHSKTLMSASEELTEERRDGSSAFEQNTVPVATGFDVFDFLDGILNDGSASVDGDGSGNGGLLDEVSTHNPQGPPILANPWATSTSMEGNQSRASAYGISFEDESERSTDQPNNSIIPLLTPAAILSATVEEEGKESENKSSSFYSDLLDE